MIQRIRYVIGIAEIAWVFLVAPVSIVMSWVGWMRGQRSPGVPRWRMRTTSTGLAAMTVSASLLLIGFGLQFASSLPIGQTIATWICVVGGYCCLIGILAAAVGSGPGRLAIGTASFFLIFYYFFATPLSKVR